MKYKLEKNIRTQDDFRVMGWHDCPIYAIQLADDVLLDIDYILEWVLNEPDKHYRFWIAPATLQFISPYDLQVSIKADFVNGLEIADIHQTPVENGMYEYHIETQEGDIRFTSKGFKQHIRQPPMFVESQYLSEAQRGGYHFETSSNKALHSEAVNRARER